MASSKRSRFFSPAETPISLASETSRRSNITTPDALSSRLKSFQDTPVSFATNVLSFLTQASGSVEATSNVRDAANDVIPSLTTPGSGSANVNERMCDESLTNPTKQSSSKDGPSEARTSSGRKRSRFFLVSGEEKDTCAICLDSPQISQTTLLDSCSHIFCFECIREWSNVSVACPLCKRLFKKLYCMGFEHAVEAPTASGKESDSNDESESEDESERAYLSEGTDLSGFIVSDSESIEEQEESNDAIIVVVTPPRPTRQTGRIRRLVAQDID